MIHFKLNEIMGKKRLKIQDIANMTGVHRNIITKYYNDDITRFDRNILDKLCKALDCKIEELLEFVKDEEAKL